MSSNKSIEQKVKDGRTPADTCRVDNPLPPKIPEGEYEAVCSKVEVGPGFEKGGRLLYLHFRLNDDQHQDLSLRMVIKPYVKITHRTKQYKEWAKVLGRPPHKGESFDRSVFKGKYYTVKVRTVVKDEHGDDRPKCLQYSIVDKIVEVQTGIPAPLRDRGTR